MVKPKDGWDKAAVIAQYVSGVVIAGIGLAISWAISNGQDQAAQKTAASNYLTEIVKQSDPQKRGELLQAMDLTSFPEFAVPIAIQYASKSRTGIPSSIRPVFDSSIDVLQRLKSFSPALEALKTAARKPDIIPSSDIAAGILGEKPRVRFKMSEINDLGSLTINDEVISNTTFGDDTGW